MTKANTSIRDIKSRIQCPNGRPNMTIFDEKYRVVAVESHRLIIRGVRSGRVLIINTVPQTPLRQEDYPLGKLFALTDPTSVPVT